MNAVRCTYIICSVILDIFILLAAILTPVYATPGYYWWTAFFIFFINVTGYSFTKRLNSWGDVGEA